MRLPVPGSRACSPPHHPPNAPSLSRPSWPPTGRSWSRSSRPAASAHPPSSGCLLWGPQVRGGGGAGGGGGGGAAVQAQELPVQPTEGFTGGGGGGGQQARQVHTIQDVLRCTPPHPTPCPCAPHRRKPCEAAGGRGAGGVVEGAHPRAGGCGTGRGKKADCPSLPPLLLRSQGIASAPPPPPHPTPPPPTHPPHPLPSDIWYGPPSSLAPKNRLLQAIDNFAPTQRLLERPLRLPVSDVLRAGKAGVTVGGKLEGGALRPGSKVLVMPSGQPATVK